MIGAVGIGYGKGGLTLAFLLGSAVLLQAQASPRRGTLPRTFFEPSWHCEWEYVAFALFLAVLSLGSSYVLQQILEADS